MKKSELKNLTWAIQEEQYSIIRNIEFGNYDEAIKRCDNLLEYKLAQLPLNSVSFFNCSTSVLFFKAQVLMEKLKLLTFTSDEEAETLWEELEKTIKSFAFHYYYSGSAYRRKLEPQMEMLMADFQYLSEEDYEFEDWLVVCLAALDTLKKRRGKENQLAYGEALVHVAKSVVRLYPENSKLKAWSSAIISEAIDILKKYDPDNVNKIAKFSLLLKTSGSSSEDVSSVESFSELSKARIKQLNIDQTSDNSWQIEVEQALYSQNYLSAIQKLQANQIEEAVADAKCAVEHGRLLLEQFQAEYGVGLESQQIMQGITMTYIILFRCEQDRSYLLLAIDLWEKYIIEIQNNNRENRHAHLANMSEEERWANISRKDIMSVLTGAYNFNPLEAIAVLNAKMYIGLCYIILGDIEQGLNCKKEMEEIIDFNDDSFDEDVAALIIYPMYINLYLYYYTQHQTEEAEQYNQLCTELKNRLRDSEYMAQMTFYDQLFEEIYKHIK